MKKLIKDFDFITYKDPGILEFKDVVIDDKTLPIQRQGISSLWQF